MDRSVRLLVTDSALPCRPGLHALWVPLCFGFAALAIHATHLDQALFQSTQRMTMHLPDGFWAFLTDQAGLLSLAAWATLLLMVRPAIATAILMSAPAGLILVRGLKHLLDRSRPQQVLSPDMIHVVGRELSGLSFPSGHTASAFAMASATLFLLPKAMRRKWVAPILILAGLVGVSRIAVGAHWPVDVLAGAAAGWMVGLTGVLAAHRWPVWQSRSGMRTLCLIGLAAGVTRIVFESGYPAVAWFATGLGACALVAAALGCVTSGNTAR